MHTHTHSPLWDFSLRLESEVFFPTSAVTLSGLRGAEALPVEPSGDSARTLFRAISDTLHRAPLLAGRPKGFGFFPRNLLKSASEVPQ